jgi:putative aldouronate transport system substrate-binding protein
VVNDNVSFASSFVGEPTKSMVENNAYLDKLMMETFCRIIMGQESVDAFDTFVNDWLAAGGSDIIKEVNEWYDSVK